MSGARTYTEWTVEVDMGRGDGFQPSPHPQVPFISTVEAEIDGYMRGIVKPKRKMRRTVRVGAWVPADRKAKP